MNRSPGDPTRSNHEAGNAFYRPDGAPQSVTRLATPPKTLPNRRIAQPRPRISATKPPSPPTDRPELTTTQLRHASPADAAPVKSPRKTRQLPVVRHSPRCLVAITEVNCASLEHTDNQSLGITYWFDAKASGEPYTVTVDISGHLQDPASGTGGHQSFHVTSTVNNVLPGSGRLSMTARVPALAAGEWQVSAKPVQPAPGAVSGARVEVVDTELGHATASGRTGFSPLVNNIAPGVKLGAWPGLVTTGFLVALVLQNLLARHLGLPGLRLFLLTVLACGLGMLGAKAYFLLTHPRERHGVVLTGMSIQGFNIVTIGTLLAGSALLNLPWGVVLDASAPALLFGMAVGRLGCLLGGCCAGRPTTSRWGIWSSDRRVGIRRIPVQVLESVLSTILGVLALLGVMWLGEGGGGLVFVATLAAYILGRQILFPLRVIPRATRHGRRFTLAVSTLLLAASLLLLIVG